MKARYGFLWLNVYLVNTTCAVSKPMLILLVRPRGGQMNQIATTKLSSKGQIVIPESIRESLHMEAGTQFLVFGLDDTIVLKTITLPPASKFKSLLAKADKAAKAAGLKKADVSNAISQVRKAKKINK